MTEPAPDPDISSPAPRRSLQVLRTGLLVAGSALLGGLAVVFWNRKSLASLRQPQDPQEPLPASPDEE